MFIRAHKSAVKRAHTTAIRRESGLSLVASSNLSAGSLVGQGGALTLSRSAGGVYVMDNEGLLRFARDNEQPFVNLRRVENVLARMSVTSSQDLTTAGWIKGGSCTVTRDATVLTDDGLSSNLITFTDNTSAAAITTASITSETAAKRSWFTAFRIKAGTVASIQVGFLDGAGSLLTQQQCTLTSSWTTFGEILSQYAGANGNVKLRLRADGAGTLYIDYGQMEEITGASVQVFGGRVGVDTQYGAGIAAVKYFATTNGNTYNSSTGVVTEAAGTALTSGAALIEAQGTNLVPLADYRDFSVWTLTAAAMVASTPVGIDGTTLTSGKNELKEDGTLAEHRALKAFTTGSATKQSAMIAVKRGSGTRHIQLRLHNATDLFYGIVTYNLDTLALIGSLTGNYSNAYIKGGYIIIELIATNVTTGAQSLYVNIHDGSAISYTGDNTSTLIFDWAQNVAGNSLLGTPQSHIQGGATRYASFLSRPWIGAVNNFWMYVDITHRYSYQHVGTVSQYLFSAYVDANNYFRFRVPADGTGNMIAETNNASSAQSATVTGVNYVAGQRNRCVVTYDSVNGLRVRCNRAGTAFAGSVSTYKTSIPLLSGATLYIGSLGDANVQRVLNHELGAYKVGTGILSPAQMADMVGA